LFLQIDPKEINDLCYDLDHLEMVDTKQTLIDIKLSKTEKQIDLLTDYILQLVKHSSNHLDNDIKLAVSTIISTKGNILIKELRNQLYITERTFERKFLKEVGVTPKQFAKIIQFSFSLDQLKESHYYNLTDVAFNNNFSDQSHFIKTFKQYAGQTPKEFTNKLS